MLVAFSPEAQHWHLVFPQQLLLGHPSAADRIPYLSPSLSVNASTLPMALPHVARKYDLVVFGATGYTGKLAAEEVPLRTPSNLKWAIAGRSPHKLELLASDLNRRFPDRAPVGTWWFPPSTGPITEQGGLLQESSYPTWTRTRWRNWPDQLAV